MTSQQPRLQAQFISTIRTLHYSRRTQEAYWHWIRAFILWSGKRHPLEMGKVEVGQFLSHLATERTYVMWAKKFVLWSGRRHPRDLGTTEVTAYLNHLAVEREVSASTQNQALSALRQAVPAICR